MWVPKIIAPDKPCNFKITIDTQPIGKAKADLEFPFKILYLIFYAYFMSPSDLKGVSHEF